MFKRADAFASALLNMYETTLLFQIRDNFLRISPHLSLIHIFVQGNPIKGVLLVAAWLIVCGVRQILEPKLLAASTQIHPLAMLAALYFALAANSFLLLVYLVCLLLTVQALRRAEILPNCFPAD